MPTPMITRRDNEAERGDVWAALAAPLPAGVISWRQDGRPIQRDGRLFARFVAYVDSNTVRERLDAVVPGEWDLTLELLPAVTNNESGEAVVECAFKARLQILGVIREDVGFGRDYKSAATDAFKRVAVRFGIAHELYAYEHNWVEMDGDGRYAKPLEDPAVAYERRHRATRSEQTVAQSDEPVAAQATSASGIPACPKCSGRMWDNRATKRSPRAPDFKCRDRSCDGVIWPRSLEGNGQPKQEHTAIANDADLPF